MTREGKKRRIGRSLNVLPVLLCVALSACATMGAESDSAATADIMTAPGAIRAGDEAARRGDFQRALAHYLRAVAVEETVEGWLRVGAACTELGQSARALTGYLKALELDPSQLEARENVGLEYLALGNDEAARSHLTKALELDPRLWRSHNGLGILADRGKDHAAAIEHYLAALELNPDSPMVLNNLGYSRYLSGDLDQAARDFYQATQLRPDYKAAWANLGMLYAQRGWYVDAVSILTRAMDRAKAYNDVGYIAYRNGDLAESEQLLSEAVRVSPTYYQAAYQNLDVVRARLRSGDQDPDAARVPVIGSSWTPTPVSGDEG